MNEPKFQRKTAHRRILNSPCPPLKSSVPWLKPTESLKGKEYPFEIHCSLPDIFDIEKKKDLKSTRISKLSLVKFLLGVWLCLFSTSEKSVAQDWTGEDRSTTVSTASGEERMTLESQQIIEVDQIEIVGNSIFNDSELKKILNLSPGTQISLEKLQEVQKNIDLYYVENGYMNSGSFLLPQGISQGKATIQVVEGILERIEIKGADGLSERYLKSQLPPEGKPLNVNQVIESIKRLRDNPLINKINGEIVEQAVGENVLLLNVVERSPVAVTVGVNNAYSPSIGSFGGKVQLTHNNLFGFQDRFQIERSQTEGLTRMGGSYSVPFNQKDGRITLSYTNADSTIIEEEIEDLEIKGDSESFLLSVQQPVILSENENLNLVLAVQYLDSETFVLSDLSFAFVDGLENGESKITTLQFAQIYTKRGDASLFLVQSQFNVGLDVFDATKTPQGIDGIFWNWQGSIQSIATLNRSSETLLVTQINLQLTPDKILPNKQITMGGVGSVRGYRSNLAVADNGIMGTIEVRLPIFRGNWGKLSLAPFLDTGTVWNNDRETTGSNTFASVGLGLQIQLANSVEARIDFGLPLVEATGYGATNTEDNWSFSLIVKPF